MRYRGKLMDWIGRYHKREKKERKRRERLMRKIQKAKGLPHVEDIFSLPSWGKRFRVTSKLRINA